MKALQGLHLHLEPLSGIAGDMAVAALVDAGVPPAVVRDAVAAMGVPDLRVRFEERRRGAFVGRGYVVSGAAHAHDEQAHDDHVHHDGRHHHHASHDHAHGDHAHHGHPHHDHDHDHDHHAATPRVRTRRRATSRDRARGGEHAHRSYADIRRMLGAARLDPDAKALAEDIFARIARVEAALHGVPVGRVAFHEVGAYDSIADVVGFSAAVAYLAPASIGSLPPVVGSGAVGTAHGLMPVPAPATAALLSGIPMVSDGMGELTTPTGAAFLAAVVDTFGPPPPMSLQAIGYGAGTRELADRANVLRVMLGRPLGEALAPSAPRVRLFEANVDDMDGQLVASLFEALFAAGALDVWAAPIVMKKGRPAQQISALVEPERADEVARAFFLNSTTLGLRARDVERLTLPRSSTRVRTSFGEVRVKLAGLDGLPLGAKPEFDDCRRLAHAAGVAVKDVWLAATTAAQALLPPSSGQGAGARRARSATTSSKRAARRKAPGPKGRGAAARASRRPPSPTRSTKGSPR